jgi:hypothetical protein
MAARRGRGEDGTSFEHRGPCRDPERHRHCPGLWRGEITLGYTSDGKRARRKASSQTKAAVMDELREPTIPSGPISAARSFAVLSDQAAGRIPIRSASATASVFSEPVAVRTSSTATPRVSGE